MEGRDIVPDMESAYARLNFTRLRSGFLISGPSKTADIEQCLVIGAHGAKSLLVLVVCFGAVYKFSFSRRDESALRRPVVFSPLS